MKLFSNLWVVLGVVLTLFGIFWLPQDLADWQNAATPWKRWFSVIDQNTALWIFALFTATYIGWMDMVRPLFPNRKQQIPRNKIKKEQKLGEKSQIIVRKINRYADRRNGYRLYRSENEILHGEIASILVEFQKQGFAIPDFSQSTDGYTSMKVAMRYLSVMGEFLVDGHINEAKSYAKSEYGLKP